MEAEEKLAETLLENRSLAREAAESSDPDAKKQTKVSKSAPFSCCVENSMENGVRVSVNGKEGSDDDVAGVHGARDFETDIPGEKEEELEDSEMNGVSSLLKMKGSFRDVDVNFKGEGLNGLGHLLGVVGKNDEVAVKNTVAGDGVPSAVNVCGQSGKIDGRESGNVGDDDDNVSVSSEEADTELGDGGGGWGEFYVGDFVWGKIRSHPWWPGQIYNPSDASEYAVKVRQKNRLLVAYFGDGSFAWCQPYQLKPFEENFDEMLKLSNTRNFLNAVDDAVDEISRLVQLKLSCSCVPKEHLIRHDRPHTANAGIKQGVVVPDGGIEKLATGLFQPAKVLDVLKETAQIISTSSLLECSVLKGWISAYNCAKRCPELPMYHEPQPIPGLEDNRTLVVDISNYNKKVEFTPQGPAEEDWPTTSGHQCSKTLLEKGPDVSGDGVSRRRKHRSIAEILEGDDSVRTKSNDDVSKAGMKSGKKASFSGKRKSKVSNESDADGVSHSTSIPRKRKGPEHSESIKAGETNGTDGSAVKEEEVNDQSSKGRRKKSEVLSTGKDGGEDKEETNSHSVSIRKKSNGNSRSGGKKAEKSQQAGEGYLSRERKKSKYLSPPYTSPSGRQANVDIEEESLKVSSELRVGEQVTEAEGHHLVAPSILKCTNDSSQKKLFEDFGARRPASSDTSQKMPKENENITIDLCKVEVPTVEVLTEIRSAALSPQYPRGKKFFDPVEDFLYIFRSSMYRNGSNYKIYKKFQPPRKRKLQDSARTSSGKSQNEADNHLSGNKSLRKKSRKKEKLDKPNIEQAGSTISKGLDKETKSGNIHQGCKGSDLKKKDKETDGKAGVAALFVSFGPGSSLPSKDDLVQIYSKYGALNVEETDVFYNNFCACVVFMKNSDAEEAFKSSQSVSPFGSANVTFRLRYNSSPFKARKPRDVPNAKSRSLSSQATKTPDKPSTSRASVADEASQLSYVRHKLEMVTSMLEMSDDKITPETKSKLQAEIKGILENVKSMSGSPS